MTDNNDTPQVGYGGKGVSTRTYWYCPTCLVTLTTYVTVTEPPTHPCGRRANQYTQLTEKGENK